MEVNMTPEEYRWFSAIRARKAEEAHHEAAYRRQVELSNRILYGTK